MTTEQVHICTIAMIRALEEKWRETPFRECADELLDLLADVAILKDEPICDVCGWDAGNPQHALNATDDFGGHTFTPRKE